MSVAEPTFTKFTPAHHFFFKCNPTPNFINTWHGSVAATRLGYWRSDGRGLHIKRFCAIKNAKNSFLRLQHATRTEQSIVPIPIYRNGLGVQMNLCVRSLWKYFRTVSIVVHHCELAVTVFCGLLSFIVNYCQLLSFLIIDLSLTYFHHSNIHALLHGALLDWVLILFVYQTFVLFVLVLSSFSCVCSTVSSASAHTSQRIRPSISTATASDVMVGMATGVLLNQ